MIELPVTLRKAVRRAFNRVGLEVSRLARNPEHSLLGLRTLPLRTILDVGANEGQFARHWLSLFPEARVIAFEPVPEAFAKLSNWASTEPRVTARNVAIGDAQGESTMFMHTGFTPSSSLLETTERCEEYFPQTSDQKAIQVQVTTLDAAVEREHLQPEILVKLDVQGYEDRVIRGAPGTLRRAAAVIVEVNVDPLYRGQAKFDAIVSGMAEAGLHFAGALEQVFGRDGHVIYFDALFLRART